jgi:putative peptide zinc metalloprotease protein
MALAPPPAAPDVRRPHAPARSVPPADRLGGGATLIDSGRPWAIDGQRPDQHAGDPVPERAEGVELLGPLAGSGYRDPPYLVRRIDGQTVQLTQLLYIVLEAIDGRRHHRQLAALVSERAGKRASAADVRFLIEHKLRPVGLLREHDGSEPSVRKRNPLLALRLRYVVTDCHITRRVTDPFVWLFLPAVVVAVLAAFAAVSLWVLLHKGLASGAHEFLNEPTILLVVFGLGLVSAGFHELGHAAACRYSGATPGVMGVALYLVWPAFYTDVTDSYRLDRWGRLRVDLGGLYFNAVFAVAAFAVWTVARWDALLLLIPLQLVHMLRQLLPFIRLDGYHILADLTGVPDLFARIGPTLRSLVPGRSHPDARALRLWARVVVTVWVMVVVPLFGALLAAAVVLLPRVMATVWESLTARWDVVRAQVVENAVAEPIVGVISMAALAVPLLSTCYLICRVAYRSSSSVWRRTERRPVLRGVAMIAGAGLLALVAWSWWPRHQYHPIDPDERGTIPQLLAEAASSSGDGSSDGSGPGSLGSPGQSLPSTITLLGKELPVRELPPGRSLFGRDFAGPVYVVGDIGDASLDDPRRAAGTQTVVVPVPSDQSAGSDIPLVPLPVDGADDNLATARNTEDGSTVYETAFTLVWVVDDTVDQTNVADARASCTDCMTVAIAFQVVLVQGDAHTVIPENQAIALNVDCDACATYAIATQLIFTVPETLSAEAMEELTRLWSHLVALEQRISDIPLDDLYGEISALEAQLIAFLTSEAVQATVSTAVEALEAQLSTSTTTATAPGAAAATDAPDVDDADGTSSDDAATTDPVDPPAAGSDAPGSATTSMTDPDTAGTTTSTSTMSSSSTTTTEPPASTSTTEGSTSTSEPGATLVP